MITVKGGDILKDKYYYNIRSVPLTQRESFNNTIILLTLVKNKYYYIIGFSRVRHSIEVGFDFESELHGLLSESVTVDFSSDDEYILIDSELKNISFDDTVELTDQGYTGIFGYNDGKVSYSYKIRKDRVLPLNTEDMNTHLLTVKKEIIDFVEEGYKRILS